LAYRSTCPITPLVRRTLTCRVLAAVLLALSSVAQAQQAKKVPARVGYVLVGTPSTQALYAEAFRQGLRYQKQIAELAIKNRLPAMFERSDYVEAGGLLSYSSDDAENYRRAAYYVDRILKGAKPADLPVEQPAKFELLIISTRLTVLPLRATHHVPG
jgi:hypothetical protein